MGKASFFPASHCDACGHRLGFFDLIPLWSYLRLGGRCRYCLAPLKKDLLWWEVGMGGSFALLGRGTAPSPLLFLTFYLFSFLVLISVMDGKEKFVYDASLLFLIGGLYSIFCSVHPSFVWWEAACFWDFRCG